MTSAEFCPNCGHAREGDLQFCRGCGFDLEAPAASASPGAGHPAADEWVGMPSVQPPADPVLSSAPEPEPQREGPKPSRFTARRAARQVGFGKTTPSITAQPSGAAKPASPACGCLFLIALLLLAYGGFRFVTGGSGAPADWTAVACTSYADVIAAGQHLKPASDAVTNNDAAALLTQLNAIDAHANPVVTRIANLGTTWEKGDQWLTQLDAVAADYLAMSASLRQALAPGDNTKVDQAIRAMTAANDALATVESGYPSLGLGCSVP